MNKLIERLEQEINHRLATWQDVPDWMTGAKNALEAADRMAQAVTHGRMVEARDAYQNLTQETPHAG